LRLILRGGHSGAVTVTNRPSTHIILCLLLRFAASGRKFCHSRCRNFAAKMEPRASNSKPDFPKPAFPVRHVMVLAKPSSVPVELGLRSPLREFNGNRHSAEWREVRNWFVPEGQADSKPDTKCLDIDVKRLVPVGRSKSLSAPVSAESVQSSRWDRAIFLVIPGTSCLAQLSCCPISQREFQLRESREQTRQYDVFVFNRRPNEAS
jgi:hypothetical protein